MAKNKTDFIARRAAAEGITTKAVKTVLVKIASEARKAAISAAEEGWTGFRPVSIKHMVGVLTSTHYKGGYIYPGSIVTPGAFQAIAFSIPGDSLEGNTKGAREWLDAAPIGTEVSESYHAGNGSSCEVYQKTQQGWGYIKTNYEGEEQDAKRRCYLYDHEAAVAAAMGVGISPTFRAIYKQVADQL